MTARYFGDAADLRWRRFQDEVVVHDRRHGRTHLLSAAAGEVLQVVLAAANGCATDDIAAAFGVNTGHCRSEASSPGVDDERAALELMMAELVRLRLTEVRSA